MPVAFSRDQITCYQGSSPPDMAVGLACQSYMSTRQCLEPYQGVRKRFRVRNRLSGKLIKMVFVFRSRQGNISQGMGDMIPCSPHPAHHFPDKDRSNLEIRGYEVPVSSSWARPIPDTLVSMLCTPQTAHGLDLLVLDTGIRIFSPWIAFRLLAWLVHTRGMYRRAY